MTGSPAIARKISAKSARWSSPRRSRASRKAVPVRSIVVLALGARLRPPPALAGDEHLAHQLLAVLAEEHVLGAAEADPLGAERARARSASSAASAFARTPEPADLVGPLEHALELVADPRLDQLDLVDGDQPAGAVDRDPVAGVELRLADPDHLFVGVDLERRGAGDARPAHPARDQGRVRGLAALRGEDPAGGVKAGDVVGLGELADEDHVLAVAGAAHGLLGA